ncbi:MAG: hypothetical protein V2A72_04245 [Candidatus Omnitrophota bacterium]
MYTNRNSIFIALNVTFLIALFIVFYPPIYAIQDEADYFGFAYKLKCGTMFFDPLSSHKIFFNGEHYVDMYPPGMAILLLPFALIYLKAFFLLNPLLHFIGFVFFTKSLRLLKLDIRLSLLYLFFPTVILYSRTIMPDAAIGSLISIAVYFYLKGGRRCNFFSGLIFGFLVLIKNALLIIPVIFLLCLTYKQYFKKQTGQNSASSFFIGLLPFTLAAVIYNLAMFKNIISTMVAGGGTLSPMFLPGHFLFYFIFLVLFYPFMFFAPLMYKREGRLEFILSALIYVIFISMWSFIQPADGNLARLIVGSRYLTAVLPIYLLTYSDFIDRMFSKLEENIKTPIFIVATLMLIYSAYQINAHHQRYLEQQLHYKDTLYNNTREGAFIVCNGQAKELLQKAWGDRKWLTFTDSQLSKYVKLYDEFYIVAFLRKDKLKGFAEDAKRKNALVKEYNAMLVAEIKQPYMLQIYKANK